MDVDHSIRKRFHIRGHFLGKAAKGPGYALTEVFQNYHLDDLKLELQQWVQLALCNDQSVYDKGRAREDLIDFTSELQRLIEAFYLLNKKKNKTAKRKQLKCLSKQVRQMLAKMNNPSLLTDDEKANPEYVISQFCKSFRRSYAHMELLDLLEAVVTYEGDKKVYKSQLVLFYEHLFVLIKLAYKMKS